MHTCFIKKNEYTQRLCGLRIIKLVNFENDVPEQKGTKMKKSNKKGQK